MDAIPASHQDLLDAKVAVLATVGPNGRPQTSVVWFLRDGDGVAISLNTSRQKTKNLQRRPQCSLLILDLADPARYLELRGDAEIEPDGDYAFADRVGAKYGADLRVHDGPGESRVVVRLGAARVRPVDMRA